MKKCSTANIEAVQHFIKELPASQQESVKACLSSSKTKKKGMRYTNQWVYECLLIRIKSKKVYEHLRKQNILTLPAPKTLSRYIQKIKAAYGFQDSVFRLLKKKSNYMEQSDKRGIFYFYKYVYFNFFCVCACERNCVIIYLFTFLFF